MIASMFLLASWLGCMIMASFGMVLGRRQNIIIGKVISASSQSVGQMIASRVIIVSHGRLMIVKPRTDVK